MLQTIRTIALAALLITAVVFVPAVHDPLLHGARVVGDVFDQRPERKVTFIGNSRTYYNDMPDMVRSIADNGGYERKIDVEVFAFHGATLIEHWENADVHKSMAGADDVIIQAQSTEQFSAEQSGQLWEQAAGFIVEAQADSAVPAMFVTWPYTDQCADKAGMPDAAKAFPVSGYYPGMFDNIQFQHKRLAEETGVDLVNVGFVWNELAQTPLDFPLYADCNHPTVFGSYLSALMIYHHLTGGDVAAISYRPNGIEPEQAALLRSAAATFLRGQES